MGKTRKTFVALVSLYIGLASGFIVPLGAPEFDDNSTLLADNYAKLNDSNQVKNTTIKKLENSLLNNDKLGKNHENEIAIYEYVTEKENNITERSLLILNQKFRTPLLNKLYNTQLIRYFTPLYNEDKLPLHQFVQPPQKSLKVGTSYFQPNLNRDMPKVRDSADYFVPHNHACSEDAKIKSYYDCEQQRVLLRSVNKGKEMKQDMIQLLDPLPVEPVDGIDQISDETIKNKDMQRPFIDKGYNHLRIQTQTNIRPSEYIRTKFGFLEPLSKMLRGKHAHRIYPNNVVSDRSHRSKDVEELVNHSEEDNIGNLIKDASDDKGFSKKSHSKNCNHRECSKSIGNQNLSYNSEEQQRNELTPFQTEDTKIEDISMDQFLNLLRA